MSSKFVIQIFSIFLLCIILLSCHTRNDSKDSDEQQQTYVRGENDQTLEDGNNSSSNSNPDFDQTKDSATVGPVAPKSPVKGGRSD